MKQQPGRKAAANDKMPGLSRSEVACSKRIRWASNAKPSEWETPAPKRAFVCSCLRVVSLVDFQQKSIQEWKHLNQSFCAVLTTYEWWVISRASRLPHEQNLLPAESKLLCRVKTTGSSMSIILQCWNISKLERDHCISLFTVSIIVNIISHSYTHDPQLDVRRWVTLFVGGSAVLFS
jgi:hypothetical protein